MINYRKCKIPVEDIEMIKLVYEKGEENCGDDPNNEYNKRFIKKNYNSKLVSSKTFFCDLNNTELMDIVKKHIPVAKDEYIANVHYINYRIGEKANPHVDTGASIKTFIILLTNNFEGGEFYLTKKHVPFEMGEIFEFDAKLLHEVKEITEGNREVLVVCLKWNNKNKKSLV